MKNMHWYYGTLHSHTRHSDGLLRPEQALWWARYAAGYDFYALTDHAKYMTQAEWEHAGRLTDAVTEPGKFVALRGFEWSPKYSDINHAGHVNVYNTHAYVTANSMPNVHDLYAWITAHDGLAHFNHPKQPIPYDATVVADTTANIFGIETGNKRFGNRTGRYLPYYQQALDAGWRVAPVYGQDNHLTPIYPYRTVIIARELAPQSLLEALRARRVYATDDPSLRIVFKLQEHWMGSVVELPGSSAPLMIFLESERIIDSVEILTQNAVCLRQQTVNATAFRWEPTLPIEKDTFLYLKITIRRKWFGIKKNIAVSAPLWIRTRPGKKSLTKKADLKTIATEGF
jgi:hypothetical protein